MDAMPEKTFSIVSEDLVSSVADKVGTARVAPPKGARFAPDQSAAALILQTYIAVPDVLVYR